MAQREYRVAISQGHGAYLMDQDTPVRLDVHPSQFRVLARKGRIGGN